MHRRQQPAAGRRLHARPGLAAALAAAALGAILAAPALASNGAKLTAYGTRAAGRGGVDYAFADDAIAPATNPAGIALSPGNRLDENWLLADADTHFRNQQGSWHATPRVLIPLPAFSFGITFDPTQSWHVGDLFDLGSWGLKPSAKDPPLDSFLEQVGARKVAGEKSPTPSAPAPSSSEDPSDEEVFGGNFRFGIGIFPVTGGAFRYRHIVSPFSLAKAPAPSYEYRTEALLLSVAPSVAYRIPGTGLAIGFSPQFMYGTLKINGLIEQPASTLDPAFQIAGALIGANPTIQTYATSHDLTTIGFSSRIGLMWSTLDQLVSVGAVYQDRSYLQDYLGAATVDGTAQVEALTRGKGGPAILSVIQTPKGRINPSLGFVSNYGMRVQNFQQPRMAGLGIALRPHARFSIGIDYTFINWSELYRVFKVRLSNGDNLNLDVLTSPSIPVRVPLNYTDQHVIAIGGSCCVLQGDDIVPGVPSFQLILRAGYNYGKSPVPTSAANPTTPIFYEHHAAFGLTFQWGPYLDFNLAMEHAFSNSIRTSYNEFNSELSNSTQTTSLTSYYFGVGVNF